ncbi:MAG: VanZ family protein [Maribacter sp.]|nr:VanZ family protein [Maribacter sp.]
MQNRHAVTPLFILALFLIVATALTQGLKTKRKHTSWLIGIGLFAVYLLVLLRMLIPDDVRGHLLEYGVLAIFIFEALKERKRNGRKVPRPALLAIGLTAGMGLLDELIQIPLPHRVFDWADVWIDFVAASFCVIVSWALSWFRRYLDWKKAQRNKLK